MKTSLRFLHYFRNSVFQTILNSELLNLILYPSPSPPFTELLEHNLIYSVSSKTTVIKMFALSADSVGVWKKSFVLFCLHGLLLRLKNVSGDCLINPLLPPFFGRFI